MMTKTFLIVFEDGTNGRVSCVLDPDRHTSHYVHAYLAEIALRGHIFDRTPKVLRVEELREAPQMVHLEGEGGI